MTSVLHEHINGQVELLVDYKSNETSTHDIFNITYSDVFPKKGIHRFQFKLVSSAQKQFYNNYNHHSIYFNCNYFVKYMKVIDDSPNQESVVVIKLTTKYFDKTSSAVFNKAVTELSTIKLTPNEWHCVDKCKLTATSCNKITINYTVMIPALSNLLTTNNDQYAHLYQDDEFTDFKLTSNNGASISVHKAVLASLSKPLKAMLIGEWKESKKNSMCIPVTTANILKEFKELLYLGKIPDVNLEYHMKLICMYDIINVKHDLMLKLYDSVSTDNCYKLLTLAIQHDLTPLVRSLSKFIVDNNVLLEVPKKEVLLAEERKSEA